MGFSFQFIKIKEVSHEKLIALTLVFFFLFGCASATVINSNPSGAKLYLDGQLKGQTPYTHTDRSAAGTRRMVTLKQEGYKDFNGEIKRQELSVPALIGGIFLLIPFIWILEYPPQHTFEMEKLK